ncbi:MAG: efflux RND transporter permease subunit [Kiritimatiellae bacterium]|nr:efflux RND transporter permease subunit [Kiritimatiellia bacterium]
MNGAAPSGLGRIIDSFLRGNLAILLMFVALAAGAIALFATPREEEPQIVVPLADVLVSYPGGSAEEVERLVSSRLERLLSQIDGVEYVYSMSMPGQAVVTVRFFVGQDREESLIKLYNKVFQNVDKATPGIAGWVIKPIEVDDVPVATVALTSKRYGTYELYRVAEEVVSRLQHIPDTAQIRIHGGQRRAVTVHLDAQRLAAYSLSPLEVAGALRASNAQMESGVFERDNQSIRVSAGPFLSDAREVADLLVGLHGGRPVYLRDVADIQDGPEEQTSYSRFGLGPASAGPDSASATSDPAVTIAVAKKKGSNAVRVTAAVREMVDSLRGVIIPDAVEAHMTRDYGQTADEKVNNLVGSLGEAVITVIVLIALIMNWRVGLIVALAVPITYSLTLLVNYVAGYTINRVTLFALILSLGLLVDDPIVAVENIYRHLKIGKQPRHDAILTAMNEVMPPLVLATLSVMVAFLPMFFISGMMGPYMRPMALNVPLAMLSSMIVSFMITPWISKVMLKNVKFKHQPHEDDVRTTRIYRIYSRMVRPFIDSPKRARGLLWTTAGLFVLSALMALFLVPLKMLPFDNKNEFQLVVDMPEGTTLETTDAVIRELENYLRTVPEVENFTSLSGAGSPIDFNGLVRHYYLREGSHIGDVRVNLAHRSKRKMNSHAIALRIRPDVEALAETWGASIKIVEVPPGPPVLSTVVAEIYGQPHHRYEDLIHAAKLVGAQMHNERGVVDIDDYVEADQSKWIFRLDRDKAARNGISVDDASSTLRLALGGLDVGILHLAGEQNETPIRLQLPRAQRSDIERLETLSVKGREGDLVQLGEIGSFASAIEDKTIYHKNLERVVYVIADTAGRGPAYPVLSLQRFFKKNPLPDGIRADWSGEGEWKITVDVFRDLGIAFAAALLGIYVLLVYETRSYALPGVIMLSIPLTMIGIMPGFWILNLLVDRPIAGFADPVFFTATAMIGMIALAGIVVRNGIILIDFIRMQVERGHSLVESILESGAVRLRPIVLTAGTTMLGAWPITLDPIFSGLAWALIFGLFVSTAFTLVIIPVVYYLIYGKRKVEVAS